MDRRAEVARPRALESWSRSSRIDRSRRSARGIENRCRGCRESRRRSARRARASAKGARRSPGRRDAAYLRSTGRRSDSPPLNASHSWPRFRVFDRAARHDMNRPASSQRSSTSGELEPTCRRGSPAAALASGSVSLGELIRFAASASRPWAVRRPDVRSMPARCTDGGRATISYIPCILANYLLQRAFTFSQPEAALLAVHATNRAARA